MTPLDAELYRLTHVGTRGDLAYYQRLCRGADSVLELGAGAGRLLRALAAPERDVWGVELEPSLLALARRELSDLPAPARKRVELRQGDMISLRLSRRFERVLLPYNGFFCLLSHKAALACLRSARRLLQPGGVFAFDVWNAEPLHAAGMELDTTEAACVSFTHAGRSYQVFERCQLGRDPQRLDVTYRYVARGVPQREQVLRQRYYTPVELARLLAAAGLELRSVHGGFSGQPFTDTSARLVLSATAC